MSKVVKGMTRLRVFAGKAAPTPAIGQALGPLGVNMMEFCKVIESVDNIRNEHHKIFEMKQQKILNTFAETMSLKNQKINTLARSPSPAYVLNTTRSLMLGQRSSNQKCQYQSLLQLTRTVHLSS